MDIPTTMKAVRFHEHGGPEVLKYEEAPVPQIGHGEALVRVKCCALNHLDLFTREGIRGWQIPLPHILGNDVSGVVAAVGPGVEHIEAGLECFVHPGQPGGPTVQKARGDDNVAPDYNILGLFRDGGYAQYVRVNAECVLPKPQQLSWEEAAAFPLTFLTAWHMLGSRRANLKSGETVLVIGGSSGVGVAAIQFAKARGCRVLTTVGSAEKAARVKQLGADEVIDHYEHSGAIHRQVLPLTGGRGVDVVVEHVGQAVFMQCIKALARGGRLVTCGTTSGGQFEFDAQMLFAKHVTIYGSFMGSLSESYEFLPLVESGAVKPVVDRTIPLEQAAEAHQRLADSKHFGKIVLVVQ